MISCPKGLYILGLHMVRGSFRITDGASIQTHKDTQVSFTGTLNGLPVLETGCMSLSAAMEISSKSSNAGAMPNPTRSSRSLSPEEAIEELKQTGVVATVSSPKRAVVTEIKIGYYASPPRDEQPYLKPTYYFRGTVEGENETGTFFHIPAVLELGKGCTDLFSPFS